MSFVYFLSNYSNSVLYVGMTSRNLSERIAEHRQKLVSGFSKKYELYKLVYYEVFETRHQALVRERQIKNWCRAKKEFLIETMNPKRKDLYLKIDF